MDNALRHGISSSPNSAQGTDSRHGTPETKLTAFSPDDLRTDQKPTNHHTLRSNLPPVFSLSAVPAKASPKGKVPHSDVTPQQHDPFVTAKTGLAAYSTSEPPKLSPTASAFTPMGFRDYKPGNIVSHTLIVPSNTSDGAADTQANISRLSPSSAPITSSGHLSLQRCLSSTTTTSSSSVASQPMSTLSQKPFFGGDESLSFHFSSTTGLSRALIISQVDRDVSNREFIELFKRAVYPSLRQLSLGNLSRNGTVFVSFDDLRDSCKALSNLRNVRYDWNVQYLRNIPNGLGLASHASGHLHGSPGDGEVVVKADFLGPSQLFDAPNISRLVIDLLGNYGDVMAYEPGSMCPPMMVYRAEYYDSRAADRAIAHLNGFKIAGCTLGVYNNNPGFPLHEHQRGNDGGSSSSGQEDIALESKFRNISIDSRLGSLEAGFQSPQVPSAEYLGPTPYTSPHGEYGTIQHSPTSLNGSFVGLAPSALEKGSLWNPRYFAYPRDTHATPWTGRESETRGNRSSENMFARSQSELYHFNVSAGKYLGRHNSRDFNTVPHNTVDIERIRLGTDVRTTIMLRNIPNKIDQAMLKEIVDETSRGKYDFMYLRIDFANNCNVGYAFINFEDPYYIIDFVRARAGQRWNRYNSDKVAEISYATIQGRDCLIQKFRNSSVMLEHPSFRPKIFYTGLGPLAGTEDRFPGPDNPSKMRRSVENAEHVGLFAPRAGQNFRDEQRRRRSQYDRGTRLAEIEDSYNLSNQECNADVGRIFSNSAQSQSQHANLYSHHTC